LLCWISAVLLALFGDSTRRRKGTSRKPGQKIAFAAAGLAAAAAAAVASGTITFSYDARGRLVKVERKGSVNNNVTAEYKYDKADNRTNVNVVSPNSPPP